MQTPPENGEDIENSESKKDNSSLISRFYKDYVEERVATRGVTFIDDVMKLSDSNKSFDDDAMKFIDSHKEFDDLGGDFKDKFSLGKVKNKLLPEYALYKNKRQDMLSNIQKYFDVDQVNITSICDKIEKLSKSDLSYYLQSSEKLKTFFKAIGQDIPEKKKLPHIFKDLNLENAIKQLSQEDQDEIHLQMTAITNSSLSSPTLGEKISDLMKLLISHKLLDNNKKIKIVETFMPSITLQQAKDWGFLDDAKIKDYIKKTLLAGVDDRYITDENIAAIQGDLKNYSIATTSLTSDQKIELLNKADFSQIAREIQDYHRLNDPEAIKDFNQLVEMLNASEKEVKNIDNFKKGSILCLTTKNQNEEVQQYYEIVSTSLTPEQNGDENMQNSIVVRNKGGNGVYSANKQAAESFTYKEFYAILQGKNVLNIDFNDIDTFKQKLSSNQIRTHQGEFEFDVTAPDENFNKTMLTNAIDELDSQGKEYKLDIGTSFITKNTLKDGAGDDIYTITKIDESVMPGGSIEIVNIGGKKQTLDFQVFYETWVQKSPKRNAYAADNQGFLQDVQTKNSAWAKVKIQDGELINENYTEKKQQKVEYLYNPDGKSLFGDVSLIRIHEVNNNFATISYGSYTVGKKKGEKSSIKNENAKYEIPLSMLAVWIKNSELHAKNLEGEKNPPKVNTPKGSERSGGILGSYLKNFASIASLSASLKMWSDNLGSYFKDGTDEQAMHLLEHIPVFSKQQEAAMKMKKEQAEKKHTDDAIEQLKILDSKDSTKLISDWLLNKNTSDSKIIGSLLYMYEKYGVLYEKGAMIQHKGTFLWYRALGGKVNDELYLEHEKTCKDAEPPMNFLEEDLLLHLIKKRCKGDVQPPLRSKLYKDVEQTMGKGLTDELAKGKEDAKKKGTYNEKEALAFGELQDGAYPNAMGAFEEMINKGNTPQRLNKLPFVMLTSGAAKSFSAQLTNTFKVTNLILTCAFTHSSAHIDIFNNTIIDLSQDIESKLGGRYIGMANKAKNMISSNNNEKNRINDSMDFYDEYQDVLGRALLRLNTGRSDEESEFETWIEDNEEKNNNYKQYSNIITTHFGAAAGTFLGNEQKGFLEDALELGSDTNGGISGIGLESFVKTFMAPKYGGAGFGEVDNSKNLWKEITKQLDSLRDSDHLDEEYRKKRMRKILSETMDGLHNHFGQRDGDIEGILNTPGSMLHDRFHEWGVKSDDFGLGGGTFKTSEKGKSVIERYLQNIFTNRGKRIQNNVYSFADITKETSSGVMNNLDGED